MPITSNNLQALDYIDGILTNTMVDDCKKQLLSNGDDPLDPGKFPSLGFANEKRGSYFIQVTEGGIMVAIWRIIGANGEWDSYNIHVYKRQVWSGAISWGGDAANVKHVDSLVHAQAITHYLITHEGNYPDA